MDGDRYSISPSDAAMQICANVYEKMQENKKKLEDFSEALER